jgi:hypothetical protein
MLLSEMAEVVCAGNSSDELDASGFKSDWHRFSIPHHVNGRRDEEANLSDQQPSDLVVPASVRAGSGSRHCYEGGLALTERGLLHALDCKHHRAG